MIKSTHRFHGHGSLRYVYQNGQTIRGSLTALKFAKNDRRDQYRIAVVVSKKVSKSAVKRNRIRRRIYEIIRGLEEQITIPYDMVITVFHDQLTTIPSDELKQLIGSQLGQAGIIHKSSKKAQTPVQ